MADPLPSASLAGPAVVAAPLVRELAEKRLVAALATVDPDGLPHVVAVWFALAGDRFVVATGSRSRKVRNVERNPRATLMLHDSRPGFEVCGASIACDVNIVRGDDAVPLVDLVHGRYVSAAAAELSEAAEFLASDDVALSLRPRRAVTWDERASGAAAALRAAGAALPLEPTSPEPTSPA